MIKTIDCPSLSKGVCNKLVIRLMKNEEHSKVMDILKSSFPRQYKREKDFWKDIINADPTVVLEMNDEIVCMSSVRKPQIIKNRNTSWLDLITCDINLRRIELGKIILLESEDLMKRMGAKKRKLHTEASNTGAVSFYSKHNWEVSKREEWGYQDAHRLTMEKIL